MIFDQLSRYSISMEIHPRMAWIYPIAGICQRWGGAGLRGVSRMDAAAKPPGMGLRRPRNLIPPRHPTECLLLPLLRHLRVQGCKPCRYPYTGRLLLRPRPMNLPLHFGLLGTLEAGLIALLVGLLVYFLWHHLCRLLHWTVGHAIGWSCVIAVIISAGIDAWKLFYMGIVRLESPLYARLFLSTIHDPNELGSRVVLEIAGALSGVALGWVLFSSRSSEKTVD